MDRTEHERVSHSRRSCVVWGDYPQDERWQELRAPLQRFETFYVSMLYQDLDHALYLGGYADRNTFSVQVEGDDSDQLRDLLATALGASSGGDRLTRAVRAFFQQCGTTILLCGSATYEVDYLTDSATGAHAGFELAQVPPGTHVVRRGKHWQYLPVEFAEQSSRPQWVELEPDRLIQFRLKPEKWKEVNRALDELVALSPWTLASAELLSESQRSNLQFDVELHKTLVDRAVARATRPFGWDARQSLTLEWPEPLLLVRALRFRRFAIELRDSIRQTLNEALAVIGQTLQFDARLNLPGLQVKADMDSAIEDVETGARPYDELWNVARS